MGWPCRSGDQVAVYAGLIDREFDVGATCGGDIRRDWRDSNCSGVL